MLYKNGFQFCHGQIILVQYYLQKLDQLSLKAKSWPVPKKYPVNLLCTNKKNNNNKLSEHPLNKIELIFSQGLWETPLKKSFAGATTSKRHYSRRKGRRASHSHQIHQSL